MSNNPTIQQALKDKIENGQHINRKIYIQDPVDWKNDETQLNANNMNRMSRGISGLKNEFSTECYNMQGILSDFVNNSAGWKSRGSNTAEIFNDYELNRALAEYSHAEGRKTVAGCKGYYIDGIDVENNYIYLRTTDVVDDDDARAPEWDNPGQFYVETFESGYQIRGDINGDGTVSSLDLIALQRHLSGEQLLTGEEVRRADINNDGVVDTLDLDLLKAIVSHEVENNTIDTEFSISSNGYYHWSFVGNIEEISGNRIKYTSATLDDSPKWKENVSGNAKPFIFFVPDCPEVGKVSVGISAHSEGLETKASANYSHTEGYGTIVAGQFGHAEGNSTKAGYAGHAEGTGTKAIGLDAHAEGGNTEAIGNDSHAEGYNTKSNGLRSHAEGAGTRADGEASHVEGYQTVATGKYAHAEGYSSKGYSYKASGNASHREGIDTISEGECSHAEGDNAIANGRASHAEGKTSTANGEASHAEGNLTTAGGYASHAEGLETNASGDRSHAEGNLSVASGNNSHAEGDATLASGASSHAEGKKTQATKKYSHAEGELSVATGPWSHAEGYSSKATADCSHAEGYTTTASGSYSHAEGRYTESSGLYSHSEGQSSKAIGEASHAEGYNTYAKALRSHTEGDNTVVHETGKYSHAEGFKTEVSGEASHAEGLFTKATVNYQHVQGKYNYLDSDGSSGNYAHIVGGGTSSSRRNIHTLDWDGNAWFAGGVTASGSSTFNSDVKFNSNVVFNDSDVEDDNYSVIIKPALVVENDATFKRTIKSYDKILTNTDVVIVDDEDDDRELIGLREVYDHLDYENLSVGTVEEDGEEVPVDQTVPNAIKYSEEKLIGKIDLNTDNLGNATIPSLSSDTIYGVAQYSINLVRNLLTAYILDTDNDNPESRATIDKLIEISDWIKDDSAGAGKIISDISALQSNKLDASTYSTFYNDEFTPLERLIHRDAQNWDEAYAKSHTHDNFEELDSIETGNVQQWNKCVDVLFSDDDGIDVTDPDHPNLLAVVDSLKNRITALENLISHGTAAPEDGANENSTYYIQYEE